MPSVEVYVPSVELMNETPGNVRSSDPLQYESATVLVPLLESRQISSRELVQVCLDQIERLNGEVNAVITVDREGALRTAKDLDNRRSRGQDLGALAGIPITVKDTFDVAGMRSTSGDPARSNRIPNTDSLAVTRLRNAGAIIIGRTNVPIHGGDIQTFNKLFGTTRNPWDLSRTPGGSSGGAAVAVACGMSVLDVGSDIAGSIRTPASYCGVCGHKPTYGIVPNAGGPDAEPGWRAEADLSVSGPIARTADDLELELDVLVGPAPTQSRAWRLELPRPRAVNLSEYRLAVCLDDRWCPTEPDVSEVLEGAVAELSSAGARVTSVQLPIPLRDSHRLYMRLLYAALSPGLPAGWFRKATSFVSMGENELSMMFKFSTASHASWIQAHEEREAHRRSWEDFYGRFDALLCPVTPFAPVEINEATGANGLLRTVAASRGPRPYLDQFKWAGIASYAYLPATTVPVGSTRAGLPIGIQIVGAHLCDRTTIDVGRRITEVLGGYRVPPETSPTTVSHPASLPKSD